MRLVRHIEQSGQPAQRFLGSRAGFAPFGEHHLVSQREQQKRVLPATGFSVLGHKRRKRGVYFFSLGHHLSGKPKLLAAKMKIALEEPPDHLFLRR